VISTVSGITHTALPCALLFGVGFKKRKTEKKKKKKKIKPTY